MLSTPQPKAKIVIVGGGFAGAYAARTLEHLLRDNEAEVALIDRRNYFVFYPLLVEAGTGALQPRHAVVATRDFLRNTRFLMAEVLSVDPGARTLTYRAGEDPDNDDQPAGDNPTQTLSFDHLILAPGSITRLPDVPGLREFAFEVKTIPHAVSLRDRAIRFLEEASATDDPARRRALLHFIVVGGNFTGVEVAGEFDAYLRDGARNYPALKPDDCKVTLVEMLPHLLSSLDNELGDWTAQELRSRGVDVRLNETVTEVAADHVTLKSGGRLDACTVLWCAGIAPSPLLKHTNLPVDNRGYLLCDRDLRVKDHPNIWGIGDSAVNLDADGKPYPATAQLALQEGQHVAANIVRVLRHQPTKPCDLKNRGMITALGRHAGVAKVFGIRVRGFPAWFLWRTVYLMKMPGLVRKIRIAIEWTLDLFFGRDFVQLGVHPPTRK